MASQTVLNSAIKIAGISLVFFVCLSVIACSTEEERLIAALKNKDARVRWEAATALGGVR